MHSNPAPPEATGVRIQSYKDKAVAAWPCWAHTRMRVVQRRSSALWPIWSNHSWRTSARRQVALLRPKALTSLSNSRLSAVVSLIVPGAGRSTGAAGSTRRYKAMGRLPFASGKP